VSALALALVAASFDRARAADSEDATAAADGGAAPTTSPSPSPTATNAPAAPAAATPTPSPPAAPKSAAKASAASPTAAAHAPSTTADKPAALDKKDDKPPVTATVRIGDRKVFNIHLPRAGMTAEARARKVTQILEQLVEEGHPGEVRSDVKPGVAVVYAGTTPIIQLVDDDAVAAGDSSLEIHAESIAQAIRAAVRTELRRRETANVVFSFSLIVLSGLVSFLLLRGVSRAARRIGAALASPERRIPGFRIGSVEVLTPAAVKVAVSTSVSIAKPIVQLGILFGWVLFSLSLFSATRGMGRKVTGFVLDPVTTLLGRLGSALPVVVLVGIGAFALVMLLRFLRVFFDSVAAGEIAIGWLPREHATPVGFVARLVAIAIALLAAAPLVTGDDAGSLRIAGVALVGAVALGATPAIANGAAGFVLLFARQLRPGLFVQIGNDGGRVTAITLHEIRLEDATGAEVRVPHLAALVRPLRVLGDAPSAAYEVTVDAKAPQGRIRKALADAVRRQGRAMAVELVEIEGADVARYRVVGAVTPGEDDLASAIADALTREGLGFQRIRKLGAAS
jgi:hypothetical protein